MLHIDRARMARLHYYMGQIKILHASDKESEDYTRLLFDFHCATSRLIYLIATASDDECEEGDEENPDVCLDAMRRWMIENQMCYPLCDDCEWWHEHRLPAYRNAWQHDVEPDEETPDA